ncbi:hypothetical protein HIM_08242 [Hirsutella minnesotensis 3608]|uniref:histone acetyltransferase n=1 Tax=Hirsutella minnesotensis 3608 TaxID=1043627 RepID=A0A0F7ZHA8_9HYPO|nr:hypothetical protein HIM_08242 [Hirsutella minnesotensis 3608]
MTPSESASANGSLRSKLRAVLPEGHTFRFHHVSTPPSKTDALCSAPPNERSDRTYCEKHFLAVSINASSKDVLVLGLEIFIYSTAFSTTLFVSKADSTGYLALLNLSKAASSPIRDVCSVFINHLIEQRRRRGTQFVVSLFARAQDQYLFPGSIKHAAKHVLDDRGLVRWWCRVLDPLLTSSSGQDTASPPPCVKGYLVVPGLDPHETRAFIPRNSAAASSWTLGHPLERISHYCREFDWVPPRCLIPRFPDDPKSRFRDELDEEAAKSGIMKTLGSWKSVKTLDTFWEVMGFRQECSSGRMTGFIWIVFDDQPSGTDSVANADATAEAPQTPRKQKMPRDAIPNTTPKKLFPSKRESSTGASPAIPKDVQKRHKKKKKKLTGKIEPRPPRIKTKRRNYLLERPSSSKYYYWSPEGRGEVIVDEGDYKRIMELLLHLDFATLDKAAGSSRRWIDEAGMGREWGLEVTGSKQPLQCTQNGDTVGSAPVNNLSGLIKRKRADVTGSEADSRGGGTRVGDGGKHDSCAQEPVVNTLNSGLVRKKPKT